ncbi:DNA-binding protein [Streptomyces marincola]|uniref:DNA-binding protein n=1 Tax=Streptomyces marincola TaxID=2878388 RepID=UPI001CF3A4EF|nr:DNA-binding protein [Streptomyces marincola]UCM88974.1 DNA-binding protein [Streptomyces marincola]
MTDHAAEAGRGAPGADPFTPDPFALPDPGEARAHRAAAALFRIAERHGGTPRQRARQVNPHLPAPHEAVRLVAFLLSGAAAREDDEPEVDRADITAALTLLPRVRAELDELEAGLLTMARGRGLTWQEIAFGLGLGTPQAARQRHDRLNGRLPAAPDATAPDATASDARHGTPRDAGPRGDRASE